MAALYEALGNGRIFALVVALLIVEAAVLVLRGLRQDRGLATSDWFPTLLAGLGLALAGLLVSLHADPRAIGASLLLAFIGHALDLRLRAARR